MKNIKSVPLVSMSVEEATEKQFALVDSITKYFKYNTIFNTGDVGLNSIDNAPLYTRKVEEVLADFFGVEDCTLVRGAGSAAIRFALLSSFDTLDSILLHDAPIYPTTDTSIKSMGLKKIFVDFSDKENLEANLQSTMKEHKVKSMLLQISRQKLTDSYNAADIISIARSHGIETIITDDNYSVMKVHKIGVELGADLSTFSMFKLLGPQGVGCVLGKRRFIEGIKMMNYSGGSAVQGFEAMEALRGLVYAPVAFAVQATVVNEVVDRLNNNEVKGVESAIVANAQSRVILVKLKRPVARKAMVRAEEYGAATYPVGSESKFEIVPMFYRCSAALIRENPEYLDYVIRINPMRAGSNTILNILRKSLENTKSK